MDIHEYQTKELFKQYNIQTPNGVVVNNVKEALLAIDKLKTDDLVVKAQIHAGGRGKAGGVKLVKGKEELEKACNELLNKKLVTEQTTNKGLLVNKLLIEKRYDFDKSMYLSLLIDAQLNKITIMASKEGGEDIEILLQEHPDKIIKTHIELNSFITQEQCNSLALNLELNSIVAKQLETIINKLYKLFIDKDLSLVEINPLVIDKKDGNLICVDGKINFDDNALYRNESIKEMFDPTQLNEQELKAHKGGLSYISLNGNIGCIVNGAGLAMATMDLLKLKGGEPANFLDIKGSANKDVVYEAFKIIAMDTSVKVILINIFGGIVRCNDIAKGLIDAILETKIKIPVIARFEGNKSSDAISLLSDSGFNIHVAYSFQEVCEKACEFANEEIY